MTELEKAAREYCENVKQSTGRDSDPVNAFQSGAQWQAKRSPWIKTSERLPIPIIEMVDGEEYGSVFVIGRTSKYESPDLHSYYGYNGNYKWEDGRVPEYWMPIPKLS